MTEETTTDPTPDVRRWIYIGKRVGYSGTVLHTWVPEDDPYTADALPFAKVAATAIGGVYEVTVTKQDDEGNISVRRNVKFTGDRFNSADHVALWQALDQAARDQIAMATFERKMSKSTELDDALEGVIRIYGRARSYGEREAIINAVISKMRRL